MLGFEPQTPTHVRAQMQEPGGDMDTPQFYCAPKLSWRSDEVDGDGKED